ncbi:hypothetical protein WICPIJ_008396 [Wickerhamomyces pijperi]|uniref:Protein transport protein SEC23 n=1 Tax=Wickerhamomyces pijperi TaxID=599730 RepID=A0A9P8PXD7_WICPI|nr:hypothetical protein WICPIJ_008396 [Wickerhamomyces pijperi]
MDPYQQQTQIPDYITQEDYNGVRLSWNALPQSKIESARLGVPLGALYTPLKQRPEEEEEEAETETETESYHVINDSPITCTNQHCGAILNPYCVLDYNSGSWMCTICGNGRNPIPVAYQGLLLPQCQPTNTTVEYILPQRNINPSIFLFVMDLCLGEDDFNSLKEEIIAALDLIPQDAMIGLVTFGKHVSVYDLAGSYDSNTTLSYSFNGARDYSVEQVRQTLGFTKDLRNDSHINAHRFLQPVSQVEYQLREILNEQTRDEWAYSTSNQRPLRSTGAALNIAQHFLSVAYPKSGAQVLLFCGGACTFGPGLIVSNELKEPIRSHHLIEHGSAKHLKPALEFYAKVGKSCTVEGTTVHVFVGAYDQVGLLEMETVVKQSGGMMVLADSFCTSIFKQSLQKFLTMDDSKGDLLIGLNATLEVKTSRQLKVSGFVGNATSLHRETQFVSKDTKHGVGLSGSSAWKLSTVFANSSYAVFFDLVEDLPQSQAAFVQFITYYNTANGDTRLKVTTIILPSKFQDFPYYFDQECATVLLARIAVDKLNRGTPSEEVIKYVDETLIAFLKRFATYLKEDVNSFSLIQQHSLLPQFIYHLKRSSFLQNFNNSPDESVFYRHYLSIEDTNNSLVMIQPTLTAFDQEHMLQVDESVAEEGEEEEESPEYGIPVLLDSLSLNPQRILLLDTFFHILIHHGTTVAQWRDQGYQNQPEYATFKKFLEVPRLEAVELLRDRFPLPRFIDCIEGDSQSRFLYARLNPTSNNISNAADQGMRILNEDVRLQDFLQTLKQTVVKA